jgi:tRNA A37 threonylcarbamoyladenosine dehydratase
MMNEERFARTISLLGKDKALRLSNAKVMVIGCGAVGGYALECIARLGVSNIVVVDFDCFENSNINRQILAIDSTLGSKKCDVAKERVLAINPDADVKAFDLKIDDKHLDFISQEKPDYVIDAIDDVVAKCDLIEYLVAHDIKFISAQGAALKFKPELLKISTLDKTSCCRLAKKLRDILSKRGVDLKKVNCVYSTETVKVCKDEFGNNVLGSLVMVPMAMGAELAYFVFNDLMAD